jgi:hypothetical protein
MFHVSLRLNDAAEPLEAAPDVPADFALQLARDGAPTAPGERADPFSAPLRGDVRRDISLVEAHGREVQGPAGFFPQTAPGAGGMTARASVVPPPTMPGHVIQSVAQKIDGKWIKQVQEPSDEFACPPAMWSREPQ